MTSTKTELKAVANHHRGRPAVVAASRDACRSNSGLVISLNGTPVDAINPLSKDPPDTEATTRTCRL